MDDQQVYERAKKRVAAKIGFYIHLTVYVAVNILLLIINLATTEYPWFKWPLVGWGVGLGVHGLIVFALGSGSSIKERMIEKELQRQARQNQASG